MRDYRLYLLKGDHIERAEPLEADTDEAAILRAEELRGDAPAELWNRARVVIKFVASSSAREDGHLRGDGRLSCD